MLISDDANLYKCEDRGLTGSGGLCTTTIEGEKCSLNVKVFILYHPNSTKNNVYLKRRYLDNLES